MMNYLEEVLSEETALTLEASLPLSIRAKDGTAPEDVPDPLPSAPSTEPSGISSAPGAEAWPWEGGAQETAQETAAVVLGQMLSETGRTQSRAVPLQQGQTAAVLLHALSEARRTTQAALSSAAATMTLPLPDTPTASPTQTLLDWDRAVQRDARRYDGGFPLY